MTSIKKLAIDSTGTMEVKDANGEVVAENGQPWTITFHSPGTKEFQKAKHVFDEKNSNRLAGLLNGKSDSKNTAEDDGRNLAEFLASVTVSLNGFDYEGRKGHEAYKAMYADLEIGHIAADSNKFLGSRGNFLKAKLTDLSSTSDKQPG